MSKRAAQYQKHLSMHDACYIGYICTRHFNIYSFIYLVGFWKIVRAVGHRYAIHKSLIYSNKSAQRGLVSKSVFV